MSSFSLRVLVVSVLISLCPRHSGFIEFYNNLGPSNISDLGWHQVWSLGVPPAEKTDNKSLSTQILVTLPQIIHSYSLPTVQQTGFIMSKQLKFKVLSRTNVDFSSATFLQGLAKNVKITTIEYLYSSFWELQVTKTFCLFHAVFNTTIFKELWTLFIGLVG